MNKLSLTANIEDDDGDDFYDSIFDQDPEEEAQRYVRPRDRQVDKRVEQGRLRKAASKDYR